MIIDYKYHIASLVAVFLALGIGILIGSTLLGNNSLVEYQKQVTDNLDNQLRALREANESIQARANTLEMDSNINKKFEEQVLPMLLADQLTQKKFAIVELNGYGFPPEISTAIKDAGGEISSVTSLEHFYDDPKKLELLRNEQGWSELNDEELRRRIGIDVAIAITGGDRDPIVNKLVEQKLLEASGDYGVPVDGVVIIGGGYKEEKRSLQIDLALIDYFKELNIPVLGVEETEVSFSSMKEYQRKHISTVDNIETAPGRLAMVYAFGGQPGNYGVKPSAQKLLPDLKKQEAK